MINYTDIFRLGHANVLGHKHRSRLVVLTIVVLFCLIFIVSTIYQGIEVSTLRASAVNTHGAAYVKTGFVEDYYYHKEYGKLTTNHAPENAEAIVRERVEKYHGSIIGIVSDISTQREWQYNIISQSVAADFINDQNDVQTKVSVIKAQDQDAPPSESFQVIGTYPNTMPGKLDTKNIILQPVFEQINPSPREVLVVDDGSEQFLEYLAQENEAWREAYGYSYDPTPTRLMVAKFNHAEDAAKYYSNLILDGVQYGYDLSSGYQYVVKDLFNNTISVAMAFTFYQMILLGLGVIFVIFAIWITVLTFAHITDEDVATIALYRSMGARTLDVYLIYGVYLLELCLIAFAICALVTLGSAAMMALFSAQSLATALQDFYQLAIMSPVRFMGFNIIMVPISLAIFMTVPITLLFIGKKFSARQIARKLKEI